MERRLNLTSATKPKPFMGIFISSIAAQARAVGFGYQCLWKATLCISFSSAQGSCLSAGMCIHRQNGINAFIPCHSFFVEADSRVLDIPVLMVLLDYPQ